MQLARTMARRVRDALVIAIAPVFRIAGWLLSRSALLRAARYRALDRQLLTTTASGMTFVVDTGDQVIARDMVVHGHFDLSKAEKALDLAGFGSNEAIFVDVGANIGSICLPLVNTGRVASAIAIEPDPTNVALLRANIVLNGLDHRVTVHNTAVGAQPDERLTFELSTDNFGDHRISSGTAAGRYGEDRRQTIEVASTTLDHLLKEIKNKNIFIWMDTQGYEGYILQGATDILDIAPPLVVEFWPYGMARSGAYPFLKAALLNGGYDQWADLSDENPTLKPLDAATLDAIHATLTENGAFTDLLLLACTAD